MKIIIRSLFVVGLLISPVFAQKPDSSKTPDVKPVASPSADLPTAKEVVDRYVKAIGGREAVLKAKTRQQTGTMELSQMGLKGTFESFARSDDRSYTRVSLDGVGDILDAYDGATAWSSNPMQGSRVKAGKELEQWKRGSSFTREANLDKVYGKLTVRGIEKVGEKDAYVVVGSTDGLPDDILYFDKETGLLVRSDGIALAPEGQQATTSFYDDYREVNGVKTPFKVRTKTPAFEISMTVMEMKYDVVIDDSKFKRPN
jgi:zinc protease